MGLEEFDRPDADGVPDLPEDLTEVDDQTLMSLFSQFVQWQDYASSQKVWVEMEEDEAAADLEQAKAMATRKPEDVKSRDPIGQLIKAEIAKDPLVIAKTEQYRRAHYLRKMTGNLAEGLERRAALISRELTRRTNNEPLRRRDARWGT